MIKVAIHGASGRLGKKVTASLKKQKQIRYVGAITLDMFPQCDVVVDVTSAEGVSALLPRLQSQKLIVGATGDLPLKDLEKYAKKSAVMVVPNFSRGIKLLYSFLEQTLEILKKNEWKFTIKEIHHMNKKDSPSGTAKKLLSIINKHGQKATIHTQRKGRVGGSHSLLIQSASESIEISHAAVDREAYADGCVEYIVDIFNQKKGIKYF